MSTSQAVTAEAKEQELLKRATKKFTNDLLALLKSRQSLIYVTTPEEKRFIAYMQTLCAAKGYEGHIWDCYKGICDIRKLDTKKDTASKEDTDIDVALDTIIERIKEDQNNPDLSKDKKIKGIFYLLLDFERFIHPSIAPDTERRLKYIARDSGKVSVILVSPNLYTSPPLDKNIAVLDFPYPSDNEIESILTEIVKASEKSIPSIVKIADEKKEDLINACKGLTIDEAQAAYAESVVMVKNLGHEPLDINIITKKKQQIIRKNGILDYVESNINLADVGGLNVMTEWFKQRQNAFSHEAREYGLDVPKGAMLIGHPGTGKSLSAKAVATQYKIPLLRLDFGKLFGSLVGESEQTSRSAIKLAESLAPCVSGSSKITDIYGQEYSIEELCSNTDLYRNSSLYIYAFNEKTNKLEKTLVKGVIKKFSKPMLRIKTHAGEIEVTKDHKLAIPFNSGTRWVEASSLKVGDSLVTPSSLTIEKNDLHWSDLVSKNRYIRSKSASGQIKKLSKKSIRKIKMGTDALEVGCLENLDSDSSVVELSGIKKFWIAGYVLGFLRGRAIFSERSKSIEVSFSSVNQSRRFANILRDGFKIEPKILEGNAICIENKIFYEMMFKMEINILRLEDVDICGYLTGLFEATGDIITCDRYPKIVFLNLDNTTKNILKSCLKVIGILDIQESEHSIFLDRLLDVEYIMECMLLDFVRDDLTDKELAASFSINTFEPNESIDYSNITCAVPSHDTMLMEEIVIEDIAAVKITAIEEAGDKECYDLNCEGNHNFFANGILCHNCVLWIDEIEKGLSGSRSSGDTDGGTTSRVVSTFLTWMQEKIAPVFVLATANNVDDIPPEFMRAGRFDEIFFVDLPSAAGREDIFRILLSRKKRNYKSFDLVKLAQYSDKYSGAEIEKAINNALFEGFSDGKREISTEDIVSALQSFKPLAVTRELEFKARNEWASSRCVMANTKDDEDTDYPAGHGLAAKTSQDSKNKKKDSGKKTSDIDMD